MKEHVKYTGEPSPERRSSITTYPADAVQVLGSEHELPIARFLATKGMDLCMLPQALYSHSRKRLLLDTGWGRMGRDVTGNALEKWITYDGQHFLGEARPFKPAPIVEDPFSWYKLRWAGFPGLCALGTRLHSSAALQLVGGVGAVVMFDGDAAGESGATATLLRLRALGIPAVKACAPLGKDPKDMEHGELVQHMEEAWSRLKKLRCTRP